MVCPFCKSYQVSCIDSRQHPDYRNRRYKCLDCSKRFSTMEVIVDDRCFIKAEVTWNPITGWQVKGSK